MKNVLIIFIALACATGFLSQSCGRNDKNFQGGENESYLQSESGPSMDVSSPLSLSEASYAGNENSGTFDLSNGNQKSNHSAFLQARKVIHTGNISMKVTNADSIHEIVRNRLNQFESYTSSDIMETGDYEITYNMRIRVVAENFDKMFDFLKNLPGEVQTKSITSNDVTMEMVDVEARLKNERFAEEQYRTILRKAVKISDILEVQSSLNQVRGEIESMDSRFKSLENQVALATINFSVVQTIERPEKEEYTGPGFFSRLGKSLEKGWKGLQNLIIGFASGWPFWIILTVLFFGIRKLYLRRKRQA